MSWAAGSWVGNFIKNFGQNWDDLPPIPLISAIAGASAPTLTTFAGNIKQLAFAEGNIVHGSQELIHRYKEGTDIYPHVHMVTNGLEVGETTGTWTLEYSMSNADAVAPYGSAFPAETVQSVDFTIPASTPDRSHILIPFGTPLDGSALTIGAYICFAFYRTAKGGTDPAADPFALTIGFHVKQNSLGSSNIGTK